jgi:hypothetical protein
VCGTTRAPPWGGCDGKAKHEIKHDAYILFVDLKKAYDAVHPSTLFAILRAMGLPPNLVNLLESRSNHRTTKVAVNGRSGDAIHMAEGVGQGDILSPILFALFIETLAVRLRKANLEGVVFPMTTPSGPKVSDLLYADDLAAVTQKAEELQTVANIVHGWCTDYGMTANIGPSKTEAMHFPLPSNLGRGGRTDALPTLTYGGEGGPAISWVQSYRYLGCMLNMSLSADYALGHVAATLRKAYAKIFFNNNRMTEDPGQCAPAARALSSTSAGLVSDAVPLARSALGRRLRRRAARAQPSPRTTSPAAAAQHLYTPLSGERCARGAQTWPGRAREAKGEGGRPRDPRTPAPPNGVPHLSLPRARTAKIGWRRN